LVLILTYPVSTERLKNTIHNHSFGGWIIAVAVVAILVVFLRRTLLLLAAAIAMVLVSAVVRGNEVVPVERGRHVKVPSHDLEHDTEPSQMDGPVRIEPGQTGHIPQHPDQFAHAFVVVVGSVILSIISVRHCFWKKILSLLCKKKSK
jgi:hypothetical protein